MKTPSANYPIIQTIPVITWQGSHFVLPRINTYALLAKKWGTMTKEAKV